ILWYDPDVVDVTEIVPGSIIINGAQDFKSYINKDNGRLSFMFVDETGLGNRMIKSDGVFAVLKATIKSTAPNGLSEITVAKEGVFADYDLNKIPARYNEGGVDVGGSVQPTSSPMPDGFTVVIDTVVAKAGDKVEIPIRFNNVPS